MASTATAPVSEHLRIRLLGVTNIPEIVEAVYEGHFYPFWESAKGQPVSGAQIADVLKTAHSSFEQSGRGTLRWYLPEFVGAFVDDKQVQADALAELRPITHSE